MTPVRGRRGKHSHVTVSARLTMCGLNCDGWIVLEFEPRKQSDLITCKACRESVEFN